MKQLTIQKISMSVYLDGLSATNLPITMPDGISSLNWFDNKIGNIFKYDGSQEEITALPDWAQKCADVYLASLPPPTPAPTPEEVNKMQAQNELYATDWTSIPDITNPDKCTPTLKNQQEFLDYRNQLRAIVLNPPAMVVQFPTKPKAKWST